MILTGDALTMLRTLESESVDCIVTSPPYWGLRDYGTEPIIFGGNPECEHEWMDSIKPAANGITHSEMQGDTLSKSSETRKPTKSSHCPLCGAWRGQLGLEPTIAMFLEHMVEIFEECRRVLKPTGTLWLNMGDAYAGSWGGQGGPSNLSVPSAGVNPMSAPHRKGSGLAPKNLIGQPWRLAFALQDAGWILRSEIIWHKPNPMPESVCDRPTRSHEQIFLFVKSKRYYYNADAIAEPITASTLERVSQPNLENQIGSERANAGAKTNENMKAVLKTKPSGWANSEHYDGQDPRYPSRSDRDAARAFSRKRKIIPDAYQESFDLGGKNSKFRVNRAPGNSEPQSAESRAVASERMGRAPGWRDADEHPPTRNARSVWSIPTQPYKEAHFATFPAEIPRRCILAGCPEDGIVLDPFAGSGTTLAVAMQLGRRSIGIELNPEYVTLINSRLSKLTKSLFLEESA